MESDSLSPYSQQPISVRHAELLEDYPLPHELFWACARQRTLLASSFFRNGLLMFMNVSVTGLAFTMWFATTMPGNASCK
jgi:hypothetical protein